jgi:murein DD-endopeptidase MepM/ murein hydrolase activator NlpD
LDILRKETKEQKAQIDGLVEKVNSFAIKMEELDQLDKNVRLMANIEDNRYKGQILGRGGSVSEETRVRFNDESEQKKIFANIHQNIDQLAKDATDQKNSFRDLLKYLRAQKSIIAASPSTWPVQGWVTSEFGYRASPFNGDGEFHKGIDIAAKMGMQVVAPADGVVTDASYDREMGNIVKIDHGHGMTTWCCHLMSSNVTKGSTVKRGDLIGYIGNSGRSTGPHLHFSVLINDVFVNPRKYVN